MLLIVNISIFAQTTVKINGLNYLLDTSNKTAIVTVQSDNISGDITIPSSVSYSGYTYNVTELAEKAFMNCQQITSVSIPNTITSLGNECFYNCNNLSSITIPSSVKSLGNECFAFSNLNSITIPSSVTSIGNYCFNFCQNLTNATINAQIQSLPNGCFYSCSSLQNVAISSSVNTLGISCLAECISLSSITLPSALKTIQSDAFSGCTHLNDIVLPSGVISLEYRCFENCSSLSKLTCNAATPPSVNSDSFSGTLYQQGNLLVPSSSLSAYQSSSTWNDWKYVKNIGSSVGNIISAEIGSLNYLLDSNDKTAIVAVQSTSLSGAITIPSSVSYSGDTYHVTGLTTKTFRNCQHITSVSIPNTITSLSIECFQDCNKLTSVSIPNSVISIGHNCFNSCSSLSSISIPNSVKSIGMFCFAFSGLNSITIPNSVKTIDIYCFYYCDNLSSVTISSQMQSLPFSCFYGCSSLKNITIPNNVTTIANDCFYLCEGLTSITCKANNPPYCEPAGFNSLNKSIPVYVPAKSIEAYKAADGWKEFTNIQPIAYILTDGETYTNSSQIDGYNISYTRTFNHTKWQALYIPFSMSYDDWKNDFDIAYINGIRQYDKNDDGAIDETIMDIIKIKNGSLLPNTPYLIKAKTTGEKTITVNNATLYKAEENSIDCRTTIAEYTFTGTYNTIPASTLIENNYYAMGGGSLVITDGTSDLKPFRWYMKIDARSPMYNISLDAKTITINEIGEEDTTGITNTQHLSPNNQICDLNGRRVNENNLKPGLYIKNGKKVIIK